MAKRTDRILPLVPSGASTALSKPKLPRLSYSTSKGLEYAVVYWRGKRFLLGRREDPAHLLAFEKFRDCVRLTGLPPTREDLSGQAEFRIADLIAEYLDHAEVYYRHQDDGSPTSSNQRIRQAIRPLLLGHGQLRAADFSLNLLKAHREDLIGKGLARVTVNGRIQVIKQMFTWAAEEGRVEPSVAANLKVLRQLRRGRSMAHDPKPRRPVAEEHMEATLPYLPAAVRGLVKTMWLTAMRVGEVAQLCSRFVDRSGPVWVFRPPRHKTLHHGKLREINIGPKAQEHLKAFISLDPDRPWFSPQDAATEHLAARRLNRKTPLFPSHQQHIEKKRKAAPMRRPRPNYDARSVAKAIHRAVDEANKVVRETTPHLPPERLPLVPYWSTHQMRHAALSRIRESHGPLIR